MLEILALLGFAYLMFLSGLEVDFDAMLPKPGTLAGLVAGAVQQSAESGHADLSS